MANVDNQNEYPQNNPYNRQLPYNESYWSRADGSSNRAAPLPSKKVIAGGGGPDFGGQMPSYWGSPMPVDNSQYDSWAPYVGKVDPGSDKTSLESYVQKKAKVPHNGFQTSKKADSVEDPVKAEFAELNDMQKLINDFERKKKKIDLTPLMALTDSWTGSHLAASYDRPMSDEERSTIAMKLKSNLSEKKADIKQKEAYIKFQESSARNKMNFEREQERLKNQANMVKENKKDALQKSRQDTAERTSHLTKNRKALEVLARKINPPKSEYDKSYLLSVGKINDDLHRAGKIFEEQHGVPKGEGYGVALEYARTHPMGPDGANSGGN